MKKFIFDFLVKKSHTPSPHSENAPNARDHEFMGVWKRVEPKEVTYTYFRKILFLKSKNYSKNSQQMKNPESDLAGGIYFGQ